MPAISSRALYASTPSGDVVAIDTRTGRELWHVTIPPDPDGKPITSLGDPEADGDLVVVQGIRGEVSYGRPADSFVTALDATTGATKWTSHQPDVISARVSGRLVHCETNGQVRTLDAATGRLSWSWPENTPEKPEAARMDVLPGIILFCRFRRGAALTALDPSTGNELWTLDLDAEHVDHVIADPEIVAVASRTGPDDTSGLTVVDRATGRRLWRRRPKNLHTDLTIRGGQLCVCDRTHIRAYDRVTGTEIWRHPLAAPRSPAFFRAEGGLLLVSMTAEAADGTFRTVIFDHKGRAAHTLRLPAPLTPAAADRGVVFAVAGNLDAEAMALDLATGEFLWKTRVAKDSQLFYANDLVYVWGPTISALDPATGSPV
ncbi:PQQ-binding-like beta-propeller repeat protein [Nonomuraea sp. B12E4]|uniref:outer membrane protein assembly factor BamB family protein n=1 Tax=Nonomuraea sp. B12E4 TaxID=3153564 RepID=UPI00325D6CAB